MSITELDHIVIVVDDIDKGIEAWRDNLGLTLSHKVNLDDAGIRQAFFTLDDGTFLELIAPAHDESPVTGILKSRGEGVHVVALKVDDLDEAVAALQSQNVKLIGVGTPQVFIHPKSANGVMVQLWPKDRPHRWRANPGEVKKDNDKSPQGDK
ncbi:MAG: VOC family protein [Pseudomonadales bacterium]